jgi:RsiW-degrading membrane proteinase PrsW (M82 family)
MWLFTFTAARTALTYITLGALTVIWAGVWYIYLYNNPPVTQTAYYWCRGFLLTGLTLAVIGFGLSLINRSVQPADMPATALHQPNVVVPNGQVVVASPQKPLAEIDLKENRLQDIGGQG